MHYVLCVKINLDARALSFVERYLILCPYLGVSSIEGSTVFICTAVYM